MSKLHSKLPNYPCFVKTMRTGLKAQCIHTISLDETVSITFIFSRASQAGAQAKSFLDVGVNVCVPVSLELKLQTSASFGVYSPFWAAGFSKNMTASFSIALETDAQQGAAWSQLHLVIDQGRGSNVSKVSHRDCSFLIMFEAMMKCE